MFSRTAIFLFVVQVRICDSGAILTMTDSKNNLKVLDVTNGKLRKIETVGTVLITRLSWDGKNLLYVSKVVTQVIIIVFWSWASAVETEREGTLEHTSVLLKSLVLLVKPPRIKS